MRCSAFGRISSDQRQPRGRGRSNPFAVLCPRYQSDVGKVVTVFAQIDNLNKSSKSKNLKFFRRINYQGNFVKITNLIKMLSSNDKRWGFQSIKVCGNGNAKGTVDVDQVEAGRIKR